ncbi:MAG: recombinase family protein [Terracidiphilus sp.]
MPRQQAEITNQPRTGGSDAAKQEDSMTQKQRLTLLFVRVATVPQDCCNAVQAASVQAQLQELRRYAALKGLKISKELVQTGLDRDHGSSVERLSSYLSQHREVRVVVVDRHDRLARSMDGIEGIRKLVKDFGVEIHFVREREVLSPGDSSTDQLVSEIFSLLARNYLQNWVEEIKEGQRRRAERGQYPGLPRFGYRVRSGRIEIHPGQAKIVKAVFALAAAGQTDLAELQIAIAQTFGRRITRKTLRRILTSIFYIGSFSWGGRVYTGSHRHLIDHDTFDGVQRLLGSNKNLEEGTTSES